MKFKKFYLLSFVIITLSFFLIGCGSKQNSLVNSSVDGFFKSIKNCDMCNSTQYINDSTILNNINNCAYKDLFNTAFSKITYKITSTDVSDNTAVVKVTVTRLDMNKIIATAQDKLSANDASHNTGLIDTMANIFFSGNKSGFTDREIIEATMNEIDSNDTPKISKDITITLNKNADKKWIIQQSIELWESLGMPN